MPAFHESGTRSISLLRWVVLHDEEAPTARGAAQWFRSHDSRGSAHLCVDDLECYRSLPDTRIPWGAASTIGANTRGLHIEQAGFARWGVALWWGKHRRTLDRAAAKTAGYCHRYKIPAVFVDANGLLAGRRGITTHAEVSKASRRQDPAHAWRYTHTDPGPFWPRRRFLKLVRAHLATIERSP
jgi:N-acetylmuramoyl-L-alanine amidase